MRGGLGDDLANWTEEHSQAAKHLGASVARIPLGWNRPDDPLVTAGIATIRAAGLRPLIAIWFHTDHVPEVDVFAGHCALYAQRYPNAMLQILNEPNHPELGNLRVEQTIEYVNAASAAIREVVPGAKLLAPALSPGKDDWLAYFAVMWDGLVKDLDPALHLYPRGDRPLEVIENGYKMAAPHGPVHVTELGFIRSVYGARRQGQLTEAALKRLRELGAATTVVYRLARPIDASEWEDEADLSVLDQARLRRAFREGMN